MRLVEFPTITAADVAIDRVANRRGFGYPEKGVCLPMATECPLCNRVMARDLLPIVAVNNSLSEDEEAEYNALCNPIIDVVAIYRCTSCNSLFSLWTCHVSKGEGCQLLGDARVFPNNTKTPFSEEIKRLSPDFIKIYSQAETAEKFGLDEICGMGFRRSLEFLVDAYIRHIKPDEIIDADMKLSQKIDRFIDNEKIKTLAQKTAWIGNDNTHIINRHPDRSVTDLKKFIRAMVTMVEAELAVEDANTIERGT